MWYKQIQETTLVKVPCLEIGSWDARCCQRGFLYRETMFIWPFQ